MRTEETWVLVADAARALLLRAGPADGPLELLEELAHPEGRAKPGELVEDKPGRSFDSARTGGRHAMEPDTDPQRAELHRFVRRLAAALDEAAGAGRFHRLVLVAGPRLLGELRDALPERVRGMVTREVGKDLAGLDLPELRERLSSVLRS